MKNEHIFYLMSGPAHLPYLVTSLCTLANWVQDRKVTVFAWPESIFYVDRIVEEFSDRMTIRSSPREPQYRGKNAQFLDKIRIAKSKSLFPDGTDKVMYLDADTTIHGDLSPLFAKLEDGNTFVATQFNDWASNTKGIQARVDRLKEYDFIDPNYISTLMEHSWPSVNGGVWCCHQWSNVLNTWEDWTSRTLDMFICDEVCLHAVMVHHACMGDFGVAREAGRWNSSPKHKVLISSDISIMHYHGDSNVRPEHWKGTRPPKAKCQFGFDFWWPIWQECLAYDYGNISQWYKDVQSDPKKRNHFLHTIETT